MTWRTVIIKSHCKLDLKLNQLEVRTDKSMKIDLSEIGVLIVENTAVSITAALLSKLAEKNVKVIFCDGKRNPQSELIPYKTSHDSTEKLRKQIRWDPNVKELVWATIVRQKVQKQAKVLSLLQNYEADHLLSYLPQILPGDRSNREGHAAKVYFNSLFGKGFSRKNGEVINSCLNYGYSILLSAFNRQVNASGYITPIGIFHDNGDNYFNLSCDLMEPFRPLVDLWVIKNMPEELNPGVKQKLADLLNQQVRIKGQKHFLLNAIDMYVKSVINAMNEGNPELILEYEFLDD